MKSKNNLITTCLFTSVATASLALINKWIFIFSDKNALPKNCLSYNWRFGNISYNQYGKGKPLLLLHDLLPGNSAAEWKNVIRKLSDSHTVYTLDLLGFGRSDKPAMTYTNYLYVQLITDFVKNVIGKCTDIIATGSSSSIAILSCCNDKNLFDHIILVNPDSPKKAEQIPDRRTKLGKRIIEFPVIGTFLYNMMMSKLVLKKEMSRYYFANPSYFNRDLLLAFHEAAHLKGYNAKYIYSSITGNYVNFGISHKIGEIYRPISIIGGSQESSMRETIKGYQTLNSSIKSGFITGSKHFPQIEKPEDFFQLCQTFLSFR